MPLELEFQLTGCVNNAPTQLSGKGHRDEDHLSLEVDGHEPPLHWDSPLGVLTALPALWIASPEPGVPVSYWSRTVLHDEQGREAGAWAISGSVQIEARALSLRGQFTEGSARLEVGERVNRIEPLDLMTMPVRHQLVVTSNWSVATGRGSAYRAVTTSAWGRGAEAVGGAHMRVCVGLSRVPGPEPLDVYDLDPLRR